MSNLKVTGSENRAGENPENVAYGFVYFNDGKRVGYTSFNGVDPTATGGWEPVTDQHVKAALKHLRAEGVLSETPEPERGPAEGVLYGKLPNNRPSPSVANVMFGRLD